MSEPVLQIPLGSYSSAERAVFEYVRDRLDKREFVKDLSFATGSRDGAFHMLALAIAQNLHADLSVTFHADGSWVEHDSADGKSE